MIELVSMAKKYKLTLRFQEIIETSFVDFIVCTCKCCNKELGLSSKREKELTSKNGISTDFGMNISVS